MSGLSKDLVKTSKPELLPLVSIITVAYNAARTIEQTIKSVINQSYENLEYIIIDGGSTDGTLDIIKKYEDRIDFWVSEADKGIYDAMNKGITYANGDLIGIINADDWYETDIITYIADCYKNTDRATVIYGLLRNFKDEQFYSVKGNSIRALKYDMIQHPTCFIPKSVYMQYGMYDLRYIYSADYDLVLHYVNSGIQFKFIDQVIANFRIGGISFKFKAQSEKYRILKKHRIISGGEAALRILLLYCTGFVKKLILQ